MTKSLITVKEYASFAYEVYFASQPQSDRELPANWQLFETCPESLRMYGYYGAAFIRINQDTKTVDLLIAHRGTDNLYGAIEDTELWLTNHAPAQFHYGVKPFITHLAIELEKRYVANAYQINWYVTGHSLGGTLAELTIADNEVLHMTGLSFESPGSMILIEQMQAENLLPQGALTYVTSEDQASNPVAVSIKARPDEINTLQPTPNPPIGPVPVPNLYPLNLFGVLPIDPGYLDYTSYSFCVEHPMKNLLEWISAHDITALPVMVEPWPMGLIAGYKWYKSYTTNQDYWDGYIDYLWDNNGILSTLIRGAFGQSFEQFKSYYIDYFLYQTCNANEQQNKAQIFFKFLMTQHTPEHATALKSSDLSLPNISRLMPYLPDAANQQPKVNKEPQNLAQVIGFFKNPAFATQNSNMPIEHSSANYVTHPIYS